MNSFCINAAPSVDPLCIKFSPSVDSSQLLFPLRHEQVENKNRSPGGGSATVTPAPTLPRCKDQHKKRHRSPGIFTSSSASCSTAIQKDILAGEGWRRSHPGPCRGILVAPSQAASSQLSGKTQSGPLFWTTSAAHLFLRLCPCCAADECPPRCFLHRPLGSATRSGLVSHRTCACGLHDRVEQTVTVTMTTFIEDGSNICL